MELRERMNAPWIPMPKVGCGGLSDLGFCVALVCLAWLGDGERSSEFASLVRKGVR